MKNNLADYLERVMQQRKLKPFDVEKKSGLSSSYIGRLLKGAKTNLTVETIGILAEALEIDPFELFAAAFGKDPESKSIDPLLLADSIQKLVVNPELIEFVQNVARVKSQKHRKAILQTARVLAAEDKTGKQRKK